MRKIADFFSSMCFVFQSLGALVEFGFFKSDLSIILIARTENLLSKEAKFELLK